MEINGLKLEVENRVQKLSGATNFITDSNLGPRPQKYSTRAEVPGSIV